MPNNTEASVQDVVNDKFAPFFRRLEKKLNMYTVPYGELQPGNIYNVPQIESVGGGVTWLPTNGEEAFSLNRPQAGIIRDRQISFEDKKRLIIRRIWGYSSVVRAVEEQNFEVACRALTLITTEMLMRLEKEVGYKYNELHAGEHYASFKMYGGLYLMDSEDSAGFEIRLHSDTYPMINREAIARADAESLTETRTLVQQMTSTLVGSLSGDTFSQAVVLGEEHGVVFPNNGDST